MQIVHFEIVDPGWILVRFVDGCELRVCFGASRARGLAAVVAMPQEFVRGRLVAGSIEWPCGYRLDAQVGRIRADETSAWYPTSG